jgi:hypothetical protein
LKPTSAQPTSEPTLQPTVKPSLQPTSSPLGESDSKCPKLSKKECTSSKGRAAGCSYKSLTKQCVRTLGTPRPTAAPTKRPTKAAPTSKPTKLVLDRITVGPSSSPTVDLTECTAYAYDLIVIVDMSGSVSPGELKLSKAFVKELASKFRIDGTNASSRIAIIGFSKYVFNQVGDFDGPGSESHDAYNTFVDKINGVRSGRGTAEALYKAATMLEKRSDILGRKVRKTVSILLTDGQPNWPSAHLAAFGFNGSKDDHVGQARKAWQYLQQFTDQNIFVKIGGSVRSDLFNIGDADLIVDTDFTKLRGTLNSVLSDTCTGSG